MDLDQLIRQYRPALQEIYRAHQAGEGDHVRSGHCPTCSRLMRTLIREVMLVMPLDRVNLEEGYFWTHQYHAERPYPKPLPYFPDDR